MKRAITQDELEALNLAPEQMNEILRLQSQKKERRYKYMVLLTDSEAEALSNDTGKEFIRATEWKEKPRKQ